MLEKSTVRMAGIMLSPSSRMRSSEDSLPAYLEHQLSIKASPLRTAALPLPRLHVLRITSWGH